MRNRTRRSPLRPRFAGAGEAPVPEEVRPEAPLPSIVEEGGDLLEPQDGNDPTVPRRIVPAAIGHPEHGFREDPRVLELEVEPALPGHRDRAECECPVGIAHEAHQVLEPPGRRVAGQVDRGPAFGGHPRTIRDLAARRDRRVPATGRILDALRGGEAGHRRAHVDDARARPVWQLQDRVMAERHCAAEARDGVFLVNDRFAFHDADPLPYAAFARAEIHRERELARLALLGDPLEPPRVVRGPAMRHRPVAERETEKIAAQDPDHLGSTRRQGLVPPRRGVERVDHAARPH